MSIAVLFMALVVGGIVLLGIATIGQGGTTPRRARAAGGDAGWMPGDGGGNDCAPSDAGCDGGGGDGGGGD